MTKSLIISNELLSNHCSYKTGGPAKFYSAPSNEEELCELLRWAVKDKIDFFILAKGNNILFSDLGFNGLIISLCKFNRWLVRGHDDIIAGAGILLKELIDFISCYRHSYIEYLSGIPGTVGGAIYMNAGAYGKEIKDFLKIAKVLDYEGNIEYVDNEHIGFAYRKTEYLENKIILSAVFDVSLDDKKSLDKDMRNDTIMKRTLNQPLQYLSCGSVFKRTDGFYPGELIEKCGLKGYTLGGCMVSEKHANFIVSMGDATSADIYSLINFIKREVYSRFGVMLEEEVKLVGFAK